MPSLESLIQQQHDLLTRLEELQAIERHHEGIDVLRDSMEQVKRVMQGTSSDLNQVKEAFEKLKQAQEQQPETAMGLATAEIRPVAAATLVPTPTDDPFFAIAQDPRIAGAYAVFRDELGDVGIIDADGRFSGETLPE